MLLVICITCPLLNRELLRVQEGLWFNKRVQRYRKQPRQIGQLCILPLCSRDGRVVEFRQCCDLRYHNLLMSTPRNYFASSDGPIVPRVSPYLQLLNSRERGRDRQQLPKRFHSDRGNVQGENRREAAGWLRRSDRVVIQIETSESADRGELCDAAPGRDPVGREIDCLQRGMREAPHGAGTRGIARQNEVLETRETGEKRNDIVDVE